MASRAGPIGLLGGLFVFACVARAAASSGTEPVPPPRASAQAGPLRVHAALGHARLDRSDGSVLVDVRVTAARETTTLPIDVALVLDVSSGGASSGGASSGPRVDLMSQACLGISELLAPGDRIAVVAYSDGAQTVLGLDGRAKAARGAGAPRLGEGGRDHPAILLARAQARGSSVSKLIL